ncbi:uncharacterized protein LOC117304057 isoform X2 [Asterias rubens]|uniref:uncharacterized protein LOC117304057 isoform X2 n=1 Tax=Asterias rubens TaxID=7604 RepID=UPI00145596CD|nr:uncharacterized protein LOC117304057 isoform X2 [Asterias rubens]
MRSRPFGATLGLVLGVLLRGCATCVAGSSCQDISLDYCRTLPYTQTGTPNMFGYNSQEDLPVHLGSSFQTLVYIGCYENLHLFLCAAAFPQCTSDGEMLPPCRYLCDDSFEKCGRVLLFYPDIYQNLNCHEMPNSTDPNVCVGLDTPKQNETRERTTDSLSSYETTAITKITNTEIYTSLDTLLATTSQPETTPLEDAEKNAANSTLVNLTLSDSEVEGQRSTESRGEEKWTDSVDKSVKTGGSHNTVPSLGIVLSTLSAVGMVVLLLFCAFFKSSFGKSFGRRRKPRDSAFYTNPAFDDLPQRGPRNVNGQSMDSRQEPYTLDDLPPHPASINGSHYQPSPAHMNPYQQEPGGYTQQNLFTVLDSSHKTTSESNPKISHFSKTDRTHSMEEDCSASGDLVYSNKVTIVSMDANANEHGAVQEGGARPRAPSVDGPPPRVTTTMDKNDDMIIANPIAC